MSNIKTLILAVIIFIGIFVFALSGKFITQAQSVSELHPVFSYEDATQVTQQKFVDIQKAINSGGITIDH